MIEKRQVFRIKLRSWFSILGASFTIKLNDREIAIFHEPEPIEDYIKNNSSVDLILHGHT